MKLEILCAVEKQELKKIEILQRVFYLLRQKGKIKNGICNKLIFTSSLCWKRIGLTNKKEKVKK